MLKQESDGTFRLTYVGVGASVGAMLLALLLGAGGIMKSGDRFTGTEATELKGRVTALEAIIEEHKHSPCHGEVCVKLGRIEERLDSVVREHYDERIKELMKEDGAL